MILDQETNKVEGRTVVNPSMFSTLDPELIRYLLSNDPLLQELEIKLGRLEWDKTAKVFFRREGVKPICNEEAIKDFLAVLSSISDKGVILSNFTEQMINVRMIDIVDMFADLITMKLDDYGIDPAHVDMIRIIFEGTAEAALRRAYKGEGIRSLGNSMERKEIIQTPQRKGFFR